MSLPSPPWEGIKEREIRKLIIHPHSSRSTDLTAKSSSTKWGGRYSLVFIVITMGYKTS
jgi:hypothetical protein